LRGKNAGTFIAFDAESVEARDNFIKGMRNKAVVIGGSGEKAVRLRPML
jgi:4-aminobutyrate aminotransferase / (S)-3-amino-2-methylpropionate transaminase